MIPFFLLLSTTAMIMSMDTPQQTLSQSVVVKNKFSINFADQKQAFHDLTKDNAFLLKILVAQEGRGKYNPTFRQAEQLLHKVRLAKLSLIHNIPIIDKNDYKQIDSNETETFVNLITEKAIDRTELIQAINGNDGSQALKIIKNNPYVINAFGTNYGRLVTPLHYVMHNAQLNSLERDSATCWVKLLLENRANPNARDDFDNTPMHHASTPELIELLFMHGAKIDKQGYGGRTPLLNGIRLCNWPAVKCLLQYGANPNKRDDKGITPLRKALAKKNPEIVRLLLEHGADWRLEDGKNKKALCLTHDILCYEKCLSVLSNHINTQVKDLLMKEFNLMAIHNIIYSPCIYIIDTEMIHELMEWIPKQCSEQFRDSNSGAYALYEHLYEAMNAKDGRAVYGFYKQ